MLLIHIQNKKKQVSAQAEKCLPLEYRRSFVARYVHDHVQITNNQTKFKTLLEK